MALAEPAGLRPKRSAARPAAVLDAVARRLEDDPQHVLPTLRLLADPDAIPEPDDQATVDLARRMNAERLARRLDAFRARAYTSTDVRQLLGGVSRQAVAARAANRTLLSLEIRGRRHFPDWQFGPAGPHLGLARVLKALTASDRGVLAADALMRAPLPEEGGRSPAELLAAGEVDTAVHYISVAGSGL